MPPHKAPNPNSSHRLLVEGTDDKFSVIQLARRHGMDPDHPGFPYVHAAEGVETLLQELPTAAQTYERLGVIVDADLSPTGRWQALRARLATKRILLPEAPAEQGTIVTGYRPNARIGIWMMPDNRDEGTLEHFLSTLVPPEDRCWPLAETSSLQARQLGAGYAERDRAKAVIHTWLAWQEPPGRPFGTALTAKILGHASPEANRFMDWFRRLFWSTPEP